MTPTSVHWSQGDFVCGLEACGAETPATILSFTDLAGPTAYTAYELDVAAVGSRQLAGDDQQLFYMEGTSLATMFMRRTGAGAAPAALSIPRRLDVGPAVDASNVYWADTVDSMTYTLRRASRGGDGTDATVVVASIDVGDPAGGRLLQVGGELWWIDSTHNLMHVPVAGGTPASAIDQAGTLATAGDRVIVYRVVSAGTAQVHGELGTVAAGGTYQSLLMLDANDGPRFLTVAENAVWWSNGDGNIYDVPLAGGSVTTYPAQMTDVPQVFAVLPDRFLVELTAHGFRTVMR